MGGMKQEVARFCVCLSIPVIATCVYAQPDCIDFIIKKWPYITYPPQAVTREQFHQRMREIAAEKDDDQK
ncbi:TPA: hypothetical protein N0F65_010625 [Lagenidium giganteum]|uniref:Uncharacterized protein n=1 Tax=Lagenidium giganteum TaxID=4803 RepID=A0AAV2ZFM8_9STRA|nr:TPA: hypothetical protein N0F65_010625 [Lagenidium giganteum]